MVAISSATVSSGTLRSKCKILGTASPRRKDIQHWGLGLLHRDNQVASLQDCRDGVYGQAVHVFLPGVGVAFKVRMLQHGIIRGHGRKSKEEEHHSGPGFQQRPNRALGRGPL
jgi:hypothetical protein